MVSRAPEALEMLSGLFKMVPENGRNAWAGRFSVGREVRAHPSTRFGSDTKIRLRHPLENRKVAFA
jgi:hypothetical protein